MVLQNYQNLIEMTSNMIYIVALGGGFKCPRKIHLNPQWGKGFMWRLYRILGEWKGFWCPSVLFGGPLLYFEANKCL
jgi:hypothetical protein